MSVFARIVVGVDGTDWGFEALRQALVLVRPRRTPSSTPLPPSTRPRRSAPDSMPRISPSYWRRRPSWPVMRPKRSSAAGRVAVLASCAASPGTCSGVNATSCRPRSWRLGADGAAAFSESCSATPGQNSCTTRPAPSCWPYPTDDRPWRPRKIVVGLTARPTPAPRCGRPKSSRAPRRHGRGEVAATGGKAIERDAAWTDRVETWIPAHPVAALVERSHTVDLVVVGSRGVHGVRTTGSVSERDRTPRSLHRSLIVHEPQAKSAA